MRIMVAPALITVIHGSSVAFAGCELAAGGGILGEKLTRCVFPPSPGQGVCASLAGQGRGCMGGAALNPPFLFFFRPCFGEFGAEKSPGRGGGLLPVPPLPSTGPWTWWRGAFESIFRFYSIYLSMYLIFFSLSHRFKLP